MIKKSLSLCLANGDFIIFGGLKHEISKERSICHLRLKSLEGKKVVRFAPSTAQIDAELQRRLKSITGRKKSKIAIKVHEPTLSSAIEISTEGYVVDIYNSSISTVLGWPEKQPLGELIDIPEPQKSDYVTDVIKPDNTVKRYIDNNKWKFFVNIAFTFEEKSNAYHDVVYVHISNNFTAMMDDLLLLLKSLKSGTLTRDEFISVVETCNKIIDDADKFHLKIIQEILYDTDPITIIKFAERYNISGEEIPTYKIYTYPVQRMKKISVTPSMKVSKKSMVNG